MSISPRYASWKPFLHVVNIMNCSLEATGSSTPWDMYCSIYFLYSSLLQSHVTQVTQRSNCVALSFSVLTSTILHLKSHSHYSSPTTKLCLLRSWFFFCQIGIVFSEKLFHMKVLMTISIPFQLRLTRIFKRLYTIIQTYVSGWKNFTPAKETLQRCKFWASFKL